MATSNAAAVWSRVRLRLDDDAGEELDMCPCFRLVRTLQITASWVPHSCGVVRGQCSICRTLWAPPLRGYYSEPYCCGVREREVYSGFVPQVEVSVPSSSTPKKRSGRGSVPTVDVAEWLSPLSPYTYNLSVGDALTSDTGDAVLTCISSNLDGMAASASLPSFRNPFGCSH